MYIRIEHMLNLFFKIIETFLFKEKHLEMLSVQLYHF